MFSPDKHIFRQVDAEPGGDLSVHLEVKVGDTVVHTQEGDSLMSSLIAILAASAARRSTPLIRSFPTGYGLYTHGSAYLQNEDPWDVRGSGPIVGVAGGAGSDPMEIELNMSDGLSKSDSENYYEYNLDSLADDMSGVLIMRVGGNTDLNDWFRADQVTWTNDDPAKVEVPVTATGNEDYSGALALPAFNWPSRLTNHVSGNPSDIRRELLVKVRLGVGLDPTPNTGSEPTLRDPIQDGTGTNQLQYNPKTVNPPNVDLGNQTSTIEITRELANDSGSDVRVREVGLWLADQLAFDGGFDPDAGWENYFLISRDVLDETIPDQTTVSFSYKIQTSGSNDGGIMTNFNEMLYRHLDNTTRTVQDITNTDQNDGPSGSTWNSRSFAGKQSNLAGVMVGRSSTSVDVGNFSLGDRVPLGEGDGQLLRVGAYISGLEFNPSNNEAFFDLVSLFENRGSTDIDVNELGWITNGPSGYVLVARSLTNQTETISPGDLVEVRFRIQAAP